MAEDIQYSTELTDTFQIFELRRPNVVVHIVNTSDTAGDEVHIESTPDNGTTITTVSEFTNSDMNTDGTLVTTLRPQAHKLRIEEDTGNWRVWVENVNHPPFN